MPSKGKKMRQEKRKKEGKRESKKENCCVTFKPKNSLEILVSAHARTSQANILHLDQKAMKNGFVVSFSPLQHNGDQKTTRLTSKRVFRQNLFRGEWVNYSVHCFLAIHGKVLWKCVVQVSLLFKLIDLWSLENLSHPPSSPHLFFPFYPLSIIFFLHQEVLYS